jgi:DNA-binding IclR family transcriptional regulator
MTVYLNEAPMTKDTSSPSSIAKAVQVLRALAAAGDDADGITHVAQVTDLPKSTTHRVLAELIGVGLVSRSGQRYRLGEGWFELQSALACSEWNRLVDHAKRPLASLFERTDATIHFGVLDGTQVLYLEKLTARGGTSVPTRVGGRMPASCTALGKSLLAFSDTDTLKKVLTRPLPVLSNRSITAPRRLFDQLGEIRRTGLSYCIEESQPGVSCIAAPVRRGDSVVAAVSITRVGTERLGPRDEADVRRAANEIAMWIDGRDD